MMFFENRNARGGYSVKPDSAVRRSPRPKKSAAKRNSVKNGRATKLADTFYEFVTDRLPNFKLVHNKATGRSEQVPLPVSRKRMVGDFQAMLDAGQYPADLIELTLDWYIHTPCNGYIRTVTGFWKCFPVLLKRCSRELNPYTSAELQRITLYLENRFVWGCDRDTLESIVGRSLFAVEQVLDAMAEAGLQRELRHVRSVVGSPADWVSGHLSDMVTYSKLDAECYVLTIKAVKRKIKGIMNRHGSASDWVDSLDISMVRTYHRILSERK